MLKKCNRGEVFRVSAGLAIMFVALSAEAATLDRWTNSASGFWRVPSNWSGGQAPSSSFSLVNITNASSKTVTIDASTPGANLSVQKLTVGAPAGSTNILLLQDLGPAQPFRLSSTLLLDRGGLLRVSNSGLVLDGTSGGILNVTSGALELTGGAADFSTTTAAKVGNMSGGTGSLIINGGAMSFFQIQLGATSGSQGLLTLSNGVFDCSSLVSLGQTANSTGIVTVAGGQLMATNDLTKVGNLGGGRVLLTGGSAQFAFLSLAENSTASGLVDLAGGELKVVPRSTNDLLRIGSLGTGELRVRGGTHIIGSEMHLADDVAATGRVYVTGGRLIVTNEITAIGRYGYGEMDVANGSVQLTNASVGRHPGSVGILTIRTNGFVTQLDALSIGRFPGSVGRVFVLGGTLSLTNDNVWVGREGSGELIVSNGLMSAQTLYVGMSPDGTNAPSGVVTITGGTTVISSNVVVGTAGISSGQISQTGGELVIEGTTTVAQGGVSLESGTMTTDTLVVTNATGTFALSGGVLRARSLLVSNGKPFVVGDGVHAATLELSGGVYSFADGLVISRNATVSGCGTIAGNVTGDGVISTNCGVAAPMIVSAEKSGNNVTISFQTVAGRMYTLEYKDSLADPSWLQVPGKITGTGAVMTQVDPAAISPTRFYRLAVQ